MIKPLTPRELQSLAALAEGQTYAEIADELGLSSATVKVHLMRAYAKLGAQNGPHAVALGIANNLLKVPA